MGNLLKLFLNTSHDSDRNLDIFVDFEHCKPTESEYPVWKPLDDYLVQATAVLNLLKEYSGGDSVIRTALCNPNDPEAQANALNVIVPLIKTSNRLYTFCTSMVSHVPPILKVLCDPYQSIAENLENNQALFKQLAEVFEFSLAFDSIKLMKPSIQNDISFYRRVIKASQRGSNLGSIDIGPESVISLDECNAMTFFFSEATPISKNLALLSVGWQSEQGEKIDQERLTDLLASMAHVCRRLLQNKELRIRISREETRLLCYRVMTGSIIVYDHVDSNGVFGKTSKLDVKSCIQLLRDDNQSIETESTIHLISAIKNSTIHYRDESTPKKLTQLLASNS